MGLEDTCLTCFGCFILGFILSPLILQGAGMFGSSWIPGENCNTIDPKLYCCDQGTSYYGYNTSRNMCESPFGLSDLDGTAYSLQSGAFSIMMLPIVFGCFEMWCSKDGDDDIGCCGILGGFCFLLYPIAGLLSFIGCMVVAGKFSGSSFGTSFYLCLSSGLYVLAITAALTFYICYKRRNKVKRQASHTTELQPYPSAGAAAPYDNGPPAGIQMQAINIEQREVVHNPETGGFLVFMRSINVFHLVTHSS
ncbi:uncharacterized protein LOC123524496 [Mercenaria mercenaria]|uniref:uncharacterized protein LOC123524496 n=1 Tax=Mercenaria mercenaria TaxID=6596 RepID=UPI00234F92F9|nr:uncharacterized protein LOC123524496 [Mercenaria mercenaria]XP_045158682.2 uncharacterized protein LOC123524496 [Mercenaria mercenaria]